MCVVVFPEYKEEIQKKIKLSLNTKNIYCKRIVINVFRKGNQPLMNFTKDDKIVFCL